MALVPLKRIRLLKDYAFDGRFGFKAGHVMSIPKADARALIALGVAEPAPRKGDSDGDG